MQIREFDAFIRSVLPFELVEKADPGLNGLQVGTMDKEVRKAAFAVDASLETFRRAAEAGADLLFVHHGLFFGGPKPLIGCLLYTSPSPTRPY